jgi:hypothetical protein
MSPATYLSAWTPIAARITGLQKAALVHAGFLAANSASPFGADRTLQKQCEGICQSIKDLQSTYADVLPQAAKESIDRFMEDAGTQIAGNTKADVKLVRSNIVKLSAFESEFTYVLDSPMEKIRSASELAFLHLQRLIVADEDFRAKWRAAFDKGETACEQLGGVHLLWHGIWAFKVHAAGGRTDLVYQEPLSLPKLPVALGAVLTEWKKTTGDGASAYKEAKAQAEAYGSGVLAGVELADYRYLVVVTEKQINTPPDEVVRGVTYRHINIAVAPERPSDLSKR